VIQRIIDYRETFQKTQARKAVKAKAEETLEQQEKSAVVDNA